MYKYRHDPIGSHAINEILSSVSADVRGHLAQGENGGRATKCTWASIYQEAYGAECAAISWALKRLPADATPLDGWQSPRA